MDFRQTVIDALDRIVAGGAIEKAIEAALVKSLGEIINDQLKSYSDFGKQLKEAVGKSLGLNGELDLPSYNDLVLKIVRQQVQAAAEGSIQREVAHQLAELLEPPPAELKLSELIDSFKHEIVDRKRDGCVCYGHTEEITARIKECDYGGGYWIDLDEDAKKPSHQCDIRIGTSKDGSVFSLRLGGVDSAKDLFVGPYFGFEKRLFQMKVGGTKLIVDVDEDDVDKTYDLAHTD